MPSSPVRDRALTPAPPVDDSVLLRLAALERRAAKDDARRQALEARIARLEGRDRVRDDLHAAALVALAASTKYLTFTAVSALAYARQVDAALLTALTAAGVDTPRTLGRWLRTVQRTPVAGLRVERQGTNGDGALWVFRAAEELRYVT